MIITPLLLAQILFVHYIGDWILQTKEMGTNKGKDFGLLVAHVFVYGFVLLCATGMMWQMNYDTGGLLSWVVLNTFLHFCIDFFTSRFSLARKEDMRLFPDDKDWHEKMFWNCIGFDQMLHVFCLVSTWIWFVLPLAN